LLRDKTRKPYPIVSRNSPFKSIPAPSEYFRLDNPGSNA
jgi:hypothetical protein